MSVTSKQVVVILGAGPGMGLSLARVFSQQGHPVAILSRTLSNVEDLASKVTKETNSPAKGYACTGQTASELHSVFESIKKDLGTPIIGIHNPNGGFAMGAFRSLTVEQLDEAYNAQVRAGFLLAQEMLASIESTPEFQSKDYSSNPVGAIFFSGATAAMKGSKNFSTFSPAKFGQRSLSQSLAREYHPKGVHVAHFILDGPIDTERLTKMLGPAKGPDARMNPDDIASVYVDVWKQKRSAWTQEIDLRTATETF